MRIAIFSGLGRLHLVKAANQLALNNQQVLLYQGFLPSRRLLNLLNTLAFLFKRKSFLYGLAQRREAADIAFKSKGFFLPELANFLILNLWPFYYLSNHIKKLISWDFYSFLSSHQIKNIDQIEICQVRAGAGKYIIPKCKHLGIPVVVDQSIAHPFYLKRILEKENRLELFDDSLWERVVDDCNNADAILTISDFVKETYVEQGFDPNKIYISELGMSENFTTEFKRDYQKAKDCIQLVFSGRFCSRKGADYIIEASQILETIRLKHEIHLYGSVDSMYADKLSEMSSIILHGHVTQLELSENLPKYDIYLFPSLLEGGASSLAEAMHLAMPIITTKESAQKTIHLQNAYLVSAQSALEIVKAIEILSVDTNLRMNLGKNALITARSVYQWSAYYSRVTKIFSDLINTYTSTEL